MRNGKERSLGVGVLFITSSYSGISDDLGVLGVLMMKVVGLMLDLGGKGVGKEGKGEGRGVSCDWLMEDGNVGWSEDRLLGMHGYS